MRVMAKVSTILASPVMFSLSATIYMSKMWHFSHWMMRSLTCFLASYKSFWTRPLDRRRAMAWGDISFELLC